MIKKRFYCLRPGAISDVITTKDGLEIIQLVERTDKTYKPLKTVEKEIGDQLRLKQFNDAFDIESKRIVRQRDTKALDAFIREHKAPQKAYNGVTRQSSPFAQRFFTLSIDEPISYVEDNKGYIAVVNSNRAKLYPLTFCVRISRDTRSCKATGRKKIRSLLQTFKKQANRLASTRKTV